MKQKLNALELVEDIDYHLLDVQQMVRPQGGNAEIGRIFYKNGFTSYICHFQEHL